MEKLPIPVYEDPYFDYFINLYDDFLQSKSKLNNYLTETQKSPKFEKEIDSVISKVHIHLKSFKKNKIHEKYTKLKQEFLYNNKNASKFYVSIDLVQADFNSLKVILFYL
jgi:hypothetical protein